MAPRDVIVSAGGGAFGGALMDTALKTAIKSPDLTWYLSTGPNISEKQFNLLNTLCQDHVKLVRYISNLVHQMKLAKVSISQC